MSLYDDAVLVLKSYEDQEELRQAYLDHLAAHPDGMWKACTAGHITASALVIDPEHGRVLLTLHKKLRMWLQMGGHCEPEDATLEDAALREATEESGIAGLDLLPGGPVRLDRHPIPPPCHCHFDVQYAVRGPAGSRAGDQRRVARPALVRVRRGRGRGRRVGRTTAGSDPRTTVNG